VNPFSSRLGVGGDTTLIDRDGVGVGSSDGHRLVGVGVSVSDEDDGENDGEGVCDGVGSEGPAVGGP
jgi:hypothetical protein